MSYGGKPKVQKVMVQPINLIFRYLQSRARVQVWLYENQNLRIEGHIIGFDEYMNVMLDQAEEVHMKKGTRKTVGRILLKGDNITLIQNSNPEVEAAGGL
jgi:small nuclear ribonucleoprotein E